MAYPPWSPSSRVEIVRRFHHDLISFQPHSRLGVWVVEVVCVNVALRMWYSTQEMLN